MGIVDCGARVVHPLVFHHHVRVSAFVHPDVAALSALYVRDLLLK
jgi:hypothetical protein